jgi:hypothetical protein
MTWADLIANPTPQDIWSARLLVLMADQDGKDIEPEIVTLAGCEVAPWTGPWTRQPVRRRRWWQRR